MTYRLGQEVPHGSVALDERPLSLRAVRLGPDSQRGAVTAATVPDRPRPPGFAQRVLGHLHAVHRGSQFLLELRRAGLQELVVDAVGVEDGFLKRDLPRLDDLVVRRVADQAQFCHLHNG